MKFRHQFDAKYKGDPGKKIEGDSLTTPDMSLTIREMLINHTRGIGSDVHEYQGEYFDTEIPVYTDLTDPAKHRAELLEQKQEAEATAKSEKDAKASEKKAAAEAAKIAKEKEARELLKDELPPKKKE